MPISDKIKEQARKMIMEEGLQQKQVAIALSVSEKTISHWVKKYGWRNEATKELYADNPLLSYLRFLEDTYPDTYQQVQNTFSEFINNHPSKSK